MNPFEVNRRVRASTLSAKAKLVVEAILDHAGHGRSSCTASIRTLARETGVSERHVQRCIPVAVAAGWIVVERATGSVHSRCTFTAGPLVHEVGQAEKRPAACSRTNPVHEVGQPTIPYACARLDSTAKPENDSAGGVVSREQEKKPKPIRFPHAPTPKLHGGNPCTPIEDIRRMKEAIDPFPDLTKAAWESIRRQCPSLKQPKEQPHASPGHRECQADRRIPRGEVAGDRSG